MLLTRKRKSDQINHVKLECLDRANFYNTTIVEAYDQGLIDAFGRKTNGSQAAHFFCDVNAANTSAFLQLQRQYILNQWQFTLDQRYCMLDPMDIVTLTEPAMGLNQWPVRILEITEQDDGTLTFLAEDYPGALGSAPTYAFQGASRFMPNFNAAPPGANPPVIFEPPYALAASEEIWIIASGPAGWGGAQVWISTDNETYALFDTINGESAVGVLTAPLPSVAPATTGPTIDKTSALIVDISESAGEQLVSYSQQNAVQGSSLCYVDGELIAYETATLGTATGRYTLTYLVRGMYGTPIGQHIAGAQFAQVPANVLQLPYSSDRVGQTIYVKLLSFNQYGGGLQSLAAVQPTAYTIKGAALQAPLAAPSNPVTTYVANQAQISWTEISDFRPVRYEIRSGSSFQGAQILGTVAHPPFTVPGNGTFWIAAVTTPAPGIKVYSAPVSITVSGAVIALNALAAWSFDEAASGWSGTLSGNAAVSGGFLILDYTGSALSVADWLNYPDILHVPPAGTSGSYTIPASHQINVQRVAPITMSVGYQAIGQVLGQNILTLADWLGGTDILGNAASANINVQPMIAVADHTGVFGPFQPFVPGTYNAQSVKLAIQLASLDGQTQAILEDFSFTASVPDRIDDYIGVSIPSGGLSLVYTAPGTSTPAPFNSGINSALPNVQVTLTNEQAGDVISFGGASLSGIAIQVTNGGSGVARTANIMVKGF